MSCTEQPCPYHCRWDSPSFRQRLPTARETEKQRPWQGWKQCRSRGGLRLQRKLPFIPTQPTPRSGLLSFIFQIRSDFKNTVTWFSTIQGRDSQNTPATQESPFVLFHRHHKTTTKSYCLLHTERDVVTDGFVFTKAK